MKRLLIAGTSSGCGKTTITCAILAALKSRGVKVTSFKCGPDYIDPMFHRTALGTPAYNLDPFFLNGDRLCLHLSSYAGNLAIIEGAMGFYDGIAATDEASAYTVAQKTVTPVVLVINARGTGASLGAVIEGFMSHKPDNHIKGVIFNNAGESRYADLQRIADAAGVQFYGSMPHSEAWSIPSRHLGLLTAGEVKDLQDKLLALRNQAQQSLDIDGLLALARIAPELGGKPFPHSQCASHVRLAVAKDEAFCFLYEENLKILQELGCELIFFSPLKDGSLPSDISGLYICSGYPELHSEALSDNISMRNSIQQAVKRGLPTIAECGGFLYLHDSLDGLPMCGVIHGAAYKTKRLQRFGYITLTAKHDNMLCKAGQSIRSHEFHYWDSDCPGDSFTAEKAGRNISYSCVNATESLYAGFPHLYFPANPEFAKRFMRRMTEYEP